MENDEITLDIQEVEQENETEVVEETTPETTEQPVVKEEGVKLSPAEFRHYEKWKKSQTQTTQPQTVAPQPNVEETVLLATGLPEELLGELKAVAAVRKVSLLKAQNDPIFVAVKEKFEKDQKQKDASLPASRGAGNVKPKKDFSSPGLSREEHMKMVRDSA